MMKDEMIKDYDFTFRKLDMKLKLLNVLQFKKAKKIDNNTLN